MLAARATHPARHHDAGTIKLTDRDITGLTLLADQYGAPLDLLADALDVQPDRLRGILARWRHAGWADTGPLGKGPAWCWLTPVGMRLLGLNYSAREPSVVRLADIRTVLAARLWLQNCEVYREGRAWWRSRGPSGRVRADRVVHSPPALTWPRPRGDENLCLRRGTSGSGMDGKPMGLPHPVAAVARRSAEQTVRAASSAKTVRLTRPARPAFRLAGRRRRDGPGRDPYARGAPFKKGRKMHTEPPESHDGNSLPPIPESGIVAYNLREGERPDALKVRYKVTVATGAKARELDPRQAEAIRRLLQWAQQTRHTRQS
jgi:hypothetical protein